MNHSALRASSGIFLLSDDEKTARSGGRSRTTAGPRALRDADQTPGVDILLSGGDGLLLSTVLARSSFASPNVTMLTFCSFAPPAARYITLRLHRDN